MEEDSLDEEFSIIFEESVRSKVFDSATFTMPIKHLKLRKPIMLDSEQSVREAVDLMQVKQFGCVLVTSLDSKLTGIITERDIITKVVGNDKPLDAIKIKNVMTPKPEALQPDDSIAFVMNAMHVGGYRHVPVVDADHIPLAVVSVRDIIGFIVEHFPQEILNLPPKPPRKAPVQDGG